MAFDLVRVSDGTGLSEGCFHKSLCASVYLRRSSSLLHNSWRNSVKTSSKPQIICEMQLETIFVDSSHCKHPFPLLHHTLYSCVLKPGKISSCAEILGLSDTDTAVYLGSGCIPVLCRTTESDVLLLRVQRGKKDYLQVKIHSLKHCICTRK